MIDGLRAVFLNAFKSFLEREMENILAGTSERNLCACLAPPLERAAAEAGFEGYRADVEYNRKQGGQVKTILDNDAHVIRITSDLILHSRGQVVGDDNLIAIEMKRSDHREHEKQKDRARLRAMTKASYDGVWSADGETLPEHVCGYHLGYYLELDASSRRFLVEQYEHGDLVDHFEIKF
jgi:hypothetical protein